MPNLSGSFTGNFERSKKEVTLPSGRKVVILETTGKEEKILSKMAEKKSKGVIEEYLASVCQSLDGKEKPTEKQFQDMLTGDRMMVLLQTRMLTHGNIVNYKLTCPSCNAKSEHEINIEEIANTTVPYPNGDKREFSVKLEEGEVWFELPNGTTEDRIASAEARDINTKITSLRLWEVLQNGEKLPVRVEHLKSKHLSAIRKAVKQQECVMDTAAILHCTSCKTDTTVDAIVNADFLFPNAM